MEDFLYYTNFAQNIFYVFSIYFIYRLLDLKLYSLTVKKRCILYAVLLCLLVVDCYVYRTYSWQTEYGEVRHGPNYIENVIMTGIFLLLFNRKRAEVFYYIVLGFTFIQFSFLVFRFIMAIFLIYDEIFLLYRAIVLVIVYVFMKYRKHKNRSYETKDWVLFTLLAGIFYVYLYYVTEKVPHLDFTDMNVILTFENIQIIFMISVYGIFYIYLTTLGNRNRNLKETEMQLDNQKQQKRLLEELVQANQENRSLRHDLKHHFNTLEYMIDESPERAKQYIQELNEHVEMVKVLSSSNRVLDYIINSKMEVCRREEIDFTYNIQDNIKQMEDFDLISLLSNALDNAIEAQEHVNDKKIECTITNRNTTTLFIIKNTCNPRFIKKSENGFQTTKKEKSKHGIGLNRIQSIAKHYQGDTEVQMEDNIFQLRIWIPKNLRNAERQK